MDLEMCCDFFSKNIGRRILVILEEAFTGKIRKFEGIIISDFSQEPSPVSIIRNKKTTHEIYLGEVIKVELV